MVVLSHKMYILASRRMGSLNLALGFNIARFNAQCKSHALLTLLTKQPTATRLNKIMLVIPDSLRMEAGMDKASV